MKNTKLILAALLTGFAAAGAVQAQGTVEPNEERWLEERGLHPNQAAANGNWGALGASRADISREYELQRRLEEQRIYDQQRLAERQQRRIARNQYRDSDRDGVPNYADRYPNDRRWR